MMAVVRCFLILYIFIKFSKCEFSCAGKYHFCDIQPWDPWSSCSTTCGVGTQTRNKPICCDPTKLKPFSIMNCLKTCKIDPYVYQRNNTERRNCGVCKHGTYNMPHNACQCNIGYGGPCCNIAKPITPSKTTQQTPTTTLQTTKTPSTMTRQATTTPSTTKLQTTTTPSTTTQQTTRTPSTTQQTTTLPLTTRQIATLPSTARQITKTTTQSTNTTPRQTTPPTTTTRKMIPSTTTTTTTTKRQTTTTSLTTTPQTITTPSTTTRQTTTSPTTTRQTTILSTTTEQTITTPSTATRQTMAPLTTTQQTAPIYTTTKQTTREPSTSPGTTKRPSSKTRTSIGTMKSTIARNPALSSTTIQHRYPLSPVSDTFTPTTLLITLRGFDYCKQQSCHHGVCINTNNGFYCKCDLFFKGNYCEKMKSWAIVLMTTLLLAVVGACCACLWYLLAGNKSLPTNVLEKTVKGINTPPERYILTPTQRKSSITSTPRKSSLTPLDVFPLTPGFYADDKIFHKPAVLSSQSFSGHNTSSGKLSVTTSQSFSYKQRRPKVASVISSQSFKGKF